MLRLLLLAIVSLGLVSWVDYDPNTGTYTVDKFGAAFPPTTKKKKYKPFDTVQKPKTKAM